MKKPRPKVVGASSKEKARLNWGHVPPIIWAIHPRAQLTCKSTRHYLAFSRNDRQAMIRFGRETHSGYTLSAGSIPENMKLEDLYAIVEAVRE